MSDSKPILFTDPLVRAILAGQKTQTRRVINPQGADAAFSKRCPYGDVGGFLWVREAWQQVGDRVVYRADDENGADRWRPSIHMPKAASRILLRVCRVQAQRLWDITESDAKAESVTDREAFATLWDRINGDRWVRRQPEQHKLTSGPTKTRCNWDSNPWVWVVEWNRLTVRHGGELCEAKGAA